MMMINKMGNGVVESWSEGQRGVTSAECGMAETRRCEIKKLELRMQNGDRPGPISAFSIRTSAFAPPEVSQLISANLN